MTEEIKGRIIFDHIRKPEGPQPQNFTMKLYPYQRELYDTLKAGAKLEAYRRGPGKSVSAAWFNRGRMSLQATPKERRMVSWRRPL